MLTWFAEATLVLTGFAGSIALVHVAGEMTDAVSKSTLLVVAAVVAVAAFDLMGRVL